MNCVVTKQSLSCAVANIVAAGLFWLVVIFEWVPGLILNCGVEPSTISSFCIPIVYFHPTFRRLKQAKQKSGSLAVSAEELRE